MTTVKVQADKGSWRRLGSIPGCIALGCSDIGMARVNGKSVYITWGRNLDNDDQLRFATYTRFMPIHLGSFDDAAELVIPDEIAAQLLLVLQD